MATCAARGGAERDVGLWVLLAAAVASLAGRGELGVLGAAVGAGLCVGHVACAREDVGDLTLCERYLWGVVAKLHGYRCGGEACADGGRHVGNVGAEGGRGNGGGGLRAVALR